MRVAITTSASFDNFGADVNFDTFDSPVPSR